MNFKLLGFSPIFSSVFGLLIMSFFTLMERKFLAYSQIRKGPNKVSSMGILQSIGDAIKLFSNEMVIPWKVSKLSYFVVPAISLLLGLMGWSVVFVFSSSSLFWYLGVLGFFFLSSLGVYMVLLMGWSSNNKYSFLGGLRSVAQTISYEISMIFLILCPLVMLNLEDFYLMGVESAGGLIFFLPFIFFLWMVSAMAELNRAPFDFIEGESELVSGFNVEYSSGLFAFIFMAEYMNIIIMCVLCNFIFVIGGGFFLCFTMVSLFLMSVMLWVRSSFPRVRYDKLMDLTWKSVLPLSLSVLLFLSSVG